MNWNHLRVLKSKAVKMKNICFLLLVILLSSCNGQSKTQLPSGKQSLQEPIAILETSEKAPETEVSDVVKRSTISGKAVPNGPRGIIRNIMMDRYGDLWFSSFEGAFRYDGKNFISIGTQEGLNYNRIFSIMQQKSGDLWFGTVSGVDAFIGNRFEVPSILKSYMDPRAIIRPYLGFDYVNEYEFDMFKEDEGLAKDVVSDMLEDKNGELWFATEFGIGRYDGKKFSRYTPLESIANNSVNSILEDNSGHLWFGMEGDLCMYDGKSFTKMGDKGDLDFKNVRALTQDKKGVIWFSTKDGVFEYDGKYFKNFTKQSGLKENYVESIYEDNSGKIWFGFHSVKNADPGAANYDGKSFTYFNRKDGLNDNTVFSIMEDKEGNMWFGTRNGVSRYDGKIFVRFSMDGC